MFKLSLIPRERKFFVLFEQSAQNAVKITHQLKDMVHIWENVKGRVGVITDLEHQGDAITHQIFEQLHRSMITPFDREDIAQLAHSLDRAADRATNICERVVFTVTGKMEEIGASKY